MYECSGCGLLAPGLPTVGRTGCLGTLRERATEVRNALAAAVVARPLGAAELLRADIDAADEIFRGLDW